MALTDLRKSKGLLLDANLLVLLIIGTLSTNEISRNKRSQGYTTEDFYLLLRIIDASQVIIITPNILTEASNLLEGISYKNINALLVLGSVVEKFEEVYMNSLPTIRDYEKTYTKFGLSDAVIHAMAKDNYVVLTQDLRLCSYLEGLGLSVLNFNSFRGGILL